jgi:hypothetical protein
MLDGVEPGLIEEIRHAAEHVTAVRRVLDVRVRWLGHSLTTELDVAIDGGATVREAEAISSAIERQLLAHIPALSVAHVRVRPAGGTIGDHHRHEHAGHHHAPNPVPLSGELAEGVIEIVDTPDGERFRFTAARLTDGTEVVVAIDLPGGQVETLPLAALDDGLSELLSAAAPAEPHEFEARLQLQRGDHKEVLPFRMIEPTDDTH